MVSKYGIYFYVNSDELDVYWVDFQYFFDIDFIFFVEFGVCYFDWEYSNDCFVFEYGNDQVYLFSELLLCLIDDLVEVVNWQGDFFYFFSYLFIDFNDVLNVWFLLGILQLV